MGLASGIPGPYIFENRLKDVEIWFGADDDSSYFVASVEVLVLLLFS